MARRGEQLEQLAAELPCKCHIYALDVCDAEALKTAANDFIACAGLPDIVIANAGVCLNTLTEEWADLPEFDKVMTTNLLGMVNTFHPFIAAMREAKRGRLVGISSIAGIRGVPGAGAYCASKAAAISYLESLRVELRGSGVKVSTIVPGYIATPMTESNPYLMPFILPAEEAARRIARAIARGSSYAVVPWQMALATRALRLVPPFLFDPMFSLHTGRKPRNLQS